MSTLPSSVLDQALARCLRVRRLERDDVTDPLTGAFDRRGLHRCDTEGIAHARQTGGHLTVLVSDPGMQGWTLVGQADRWPGTR